MSFNEADLYLNGIVDRRLTIMTVHKAKGLGIRPRPSLQRVPQFFHQHRRGARALCGLLPRAANALGIGVR